MYNIEYKVKCYGSSEMAKLVHCAEVNGAIYQQTIIQNDTYFITPKGRLKLREWSDEFGHSGAKLISYQRPDEKRSRLSKYYFSAIEQSDALIELLSLVMDTDVRVEKQRLLYFYGNTRIHFDTVKLLGYFVELETVLLPNSNRIQERIAIEEHQSVISFLDLQKYQQIAVSYSDLVREISGIDISDEHAAETVVSR